MGRTIGITVAVLIWMAVLLAARGLVLGADDPVDAIRYQGMRFLSHWFGIGSMAPCSDVSLNRSGLGTDVAAVLQAIGMSVW
ncbi:MAG TPA: hypothetical protein DGT21_11735 [Armatimonadetes bacterium]|jgi:hypothetical protein|nr:hypothetical protein [Armatimonadota bacterium]